jgi:lysine-ketoglutarate reductase/saccharopine dehydrogenase-like protein (TIGR00300 family)
MILEAGCDYEVLDVRIGKTTSDPSWARLLVQASTQAALTTLLEELRVHGVNPVNEVDCHLEPSPADGVLPEGFYASTNLPTAVRVGGGWLAVTPMEMDCAVIVTSGHAATCPMGDVQAGQMVVVGTSGVRVSGPARAREGSSFGFMTSDVSSEKPKAQLIERVARRVQACIRRGSKILAVVGPALVHTGASPALAQLIREGFVHVLFAGNGFAAHDIESALYGTSLGVPVEDDVSEIDRHANHLRAINRARSWGTIRAGVEGGELRSGAMFECVKAGIPVVLSGSVRDDGPLPGVITDVMDAQRAMRALLPGVEVALMLGSTLHAIATGNLLSAEVETFCVDINPAVVTKLADRGTHQALGIVTDVGLFVRELAALLCTR